ncbi:hypothetical protein SD70_01590 [Gordoniibacillus kamchatkensis]|uniref:Uncharacterized protein n=1 Tax=Gordoniibacillus kamchatkensis TaxID=1590651 RepID=A0ABR5AMJ3_9BACL|nr:hypothetical protein [Paenibacillus sp. VKM B-2647]KIL42257.1 hypothetical protein SD70_01590 [Paenibacillus sp. VKM B-2647]
MEKIVAIIALILLPIIIGTVFYYLIKQKNELLEIEQSAELVKSFTGGGKFRDGFVTTKLSYPFVQIRLYEDFFVISYSKKLIFRYSEILSIRLTISGLKINHGKEGFPKAIYVSSEKHLIEFLISKGIRQEDNKMGMSIL